MKDTTFYNQESIQYSQKRYPKVAQSYTQFFFNRRLSIAKKYLAQVIQTEDKPLSLLELGCADGVVVREFHHTFPRAFSKLVGIDVSSGMVDEARRQNVIPEAEFLLRREYINRLPVDVINETGVINYAGFDEDIAFVTHNLKEKGWYILSVAGTDSLRNKFKGEKEFTDFRPYQTYEKILHAKFEVHAVTGCGIFVPHIWKIPAVARVLQPITEILVGTLSPDWSHEKVFLLKKK